MAVDARELSEIAKLVAELTQQKLGVMPQLDIGNFAVNLFGRLLGEYQAHKEGMIRIEDFKASNIQLNLYRRHDVNRR